MRQVGGKRKREYISMSIESIILRINIKNYNLYHKNGWNIMKLTGWNLNDTIKLKNIYKSVTPKHIDTDNIKENRTSILI